MSHYICRAGSTAALALALLTWPFCAPFEAHAQVQSEPLPDVKAPAKKGLSAKAQDGGSSGEAALRKRVEQLEEQLVDLQVVIGTLESLARSGGVRPPPASYGGSGSVPMSGNEQARLDSMETQIRALTAQIEQLASEVRAGGGRRSDAAAPGGFGGASGAPVSTSQFGSTTVTSTQTDPIGELVAADQVGSASNSAGTNSLPPAGSQAPMASSSMQTAAVDPKAGAASSKQLYETAYGYLLQQDYASAQAGFSDFLKTYPGDPLAPNALYWLGEAYYVQRNFADAAEAFDLVVTTYASSNKAADAQLKRGMSLAQLGKKEDACAAFRSLATKFPSAPALIKSKADGEKQRAGCT